MNTFLYTLDFDESGIIAENADLIRASSLKHAKAEIERLTDQTVDHFERADFGDCWLKTYSNLQGRKIDIIDGIKCHIKRPGTHPGGNAYWLEPVKTVWRPVFTSYQVGYYRSDNSTSCEYYEFCQESEAREFAECLNHYDWSAERPGAFLTKMANTAPISAETWNGDKWERLP